MKNANCAETAPVWQPCVAWVRDKWRAVLNTVVKLHVSWMCGIVWESIGITRRINLHVVTYSDIILSSQIIVISAGAFISSSCLLFWSLPFVCYKTELNGCKDNILFSDIIDIEHTSDNKLAQVEGSRILSMSERHRHVKKSSALWSYLTYN